METVGELDEHDPDVVDHGQHHFAEVFSLLFFAGSEVDFADLGDAFHQVRDLLSEFLADVDDGDGKCLPRSREAGPRRSRRRRVSCPRGPWLLPADEPGKARRRRGTGRMVLQGEIVGAADDLQIVVGTVSTDRLDEVTEARDPQTCWSRSVGEASPCLIIG